MKLKATLRATVTRKGLTRHLIQTTGGVREAGEVKYIEIAESDGLGVFLFRYGIDDRIVADTWHEDVEDAKRQAKFEYGVEASDWRSAPTVE